MHRRAFLSALALLPLAACAGGGFGSGGLEPPEVTLSDIQFRGAGLLEQKLGLVLRLRNPNETDLALDGMRVQLDVDGEPFATGLSNENVTVPALGEGMVTVEAISGTAGILGRLRSVTGLQDIDYSLKGTTFLRDGGRKLPFEQKGTVRLSGLTQ